MWQDDSVNTDKNLLVLTKTDLRILYCRFCSPSQTTDLVTQDLFAVETYRKSCTSSTSSDWQVALDHSIAMQPIGKDHTASMNCGADIARPQGNLEKLVCSSILVICCQACQSRGAEATVLRIMEAVLSQRPFRATAERICQAEIQLTQTSGTFINQV